MTMTDEPITASEEPCADCGAESEPTGASVLPDELAAHLAAQHAAVKGAHSHAHPTYGSQGGDASHEHLHSHDDDAHHEHDHAMRVPGRVIVACLPAGVSGFVASACPAAVDHDYRAALVASLESLGSGWGVQQIEDRWAVLARDGAEVGMFVSYQEAIGRIGELAASDRPVLAERWRSDMAFENVSTGDGRRIGAGAISFRDCPLPLMLQTETDVGHFGAVLAGSIESAGMVGQTATGAGSFDDSDAGRQSLDIISARGRFGVSVDIGESEADFQCSDYDADGNCTDGELVFTRAQVMGLTQTPFPAFADAYIELAEKPAVAASAVGYVRAPGTTNDVTVTWASTAGGMAVPGTISATGADLELPVTAAGGPVAPPAAWFSDPKLTKPTPLTVTKEGQVYGHLADWRTCHTGFAGQCVRAPRSKSGYAYFTTGALTCDDDSVVRVGQLTMGCGHADKRAGHTAAMAHYDGGPGATQMADVAVGEDSHGIWVAGALRPGLSDEAVREFAAQALSGDWRVVSRGGGYELVAALSVPVPGFPIAASAWAEPMVLPEPALFLLDGEPVSLVAAGVVGRRAPWADRIDELGALVASLEARLVAAERVTGQLRSLAAERLVARIA